MRTNFLSIVFSVAVLFGSFALSLPGPAQAADAGNIRQALQQRYRLSRMKVGNPAFEGQLLERGSVLGACSI